MIVRSLGKRYALWVAVNHYLFKFGKAQLPEPLSFSLAHIHRSLLLFFVAYNKNVVELKKLGIAHLLVQGRLGDVELHLPTSAL